MPESSQAGWRLLGVWDGLHKPGGRGASTTESEKNTELSSAETDVCSESVGVSTALFMGTGYPGTHPGSPF